jgi:hypothetical protein
MKTMTIRGIDPSLDQALKAAAQADANSVNQLVIDILKERFGLAKAAQHTRRHHDLDDLFGSWSDDHYQHMETVIEQQRRIDPELWE